MTAAWRLIEDGPASGDWNMGVDESLLASAAACGLATLRLYTWQGPWLSLGYAQRPDPTLVERCGLAGVGIIRRVTGGRAVLHGGDLTYAIAAREDVLPAGLRASYDLVARALLGALQALGVDATRTPSDAPPPGRSTFDCFAAPAGDEICVGGGKLAGSAQRRAGGCVLQHGSIRLRPDPPAAAEASRLVGEGATSLVEAGYVVSEGALRAALVPAFAGVLGRRIEAGTLSPAEREGARARCNSRRSEPLSTPPLGV